MKTKWMKRVLAAMLLSLLAAFVLNIPAAAAQPGDTMYCTDDMNFRSGPGGSYSIIGTVPNGAQVTWLGQSGEWDNIVYSGTTGYIHAGNLSESGQIDPDVSGEVMYVSVNDGYLALRSYAMTTPDNEIGRLYNGESVIVQSQASGDFYYVYSPKTGEYGYVNGNYLVYTPPGSDIPSGTKMYVNVDGYLALRDAPYYDASNEIGKLYTGESVIVEDTTQSSYYYYVYSTKLDMYGYVDKDYLSYSAPYTPDPTPSPTSNTYTVVVDDGYLALREWPDFDASNEIGKMYTGDVVSLLSVYDDTYWFVYCPRLGMNGYTNCNYLTQ